jgi:hypothetical protein
MSRISFALCLSMFCILAVHHPGYADVKTGLVDSNGRIFEDLEDEPQARQTYQNPRVPDGSIVIGPPGKFSVFKSQEGFGLVDQSGNIVIKPAPDYLFPVDDELFVRQQQGLQSGFLLMDSSGKQLAIFDQRASLVGKHFSEGLIIVNHGFGNTMNYCDKNGKPISDQMFTDGGAFSEGLANVRIATREQSGGGYIDHAGKFVIGPFQSAECSPFKDGIGIVSYYTITPEGTWLFKRGAVDKTGKFIIAPNYAELSRFSKTSFLAKLNDRFELLDFSNKKIMQFPSGCKEVLAAKSGSSSELICCGFSSRTETARRSTEPEPLDWGYSDMKGNLVIAPKFYKCEPFENGCAVVATKSDGKVLVGLIDESGNWKIKPIYQSLERLANGHFQYRLEEESKVAKKPTESEIAETLHHTHHHERFYELLKTHDVIGMTIADLHKYLGDPIESRPDAEPKAELLPSAIKSMIQYDASVDGPHCGNGSMQIELGLDKFQKVCAWRLNGMQSHGQWYTENVVFDDAQDGVRLPRPKM